MNPIRPKILIVDDLEATRFLARTVLRRNDEYEFFEASNGQEGVETAFREIPHLIMMDAMMPVMDGFEAITILRNDPRTRQIPILMVSALDTHDDKIRALTTGISDFIAKPFDKTELIIRVNSLLHLYMSYLEKQEELNSLNNALEQKVQDRTVELRRKEGYTRAILDSTPNLICVFDRNGYIADMNQAWWEFFTEIDPSKPLKYNLLYLKPYITELDDPHFLNAYPPSEWFEMLMNDETSHKLQIVKNDRMTLFSVTMRNVLSDDRNRASVEEHYILTLNDITELERIRQERENQIKLASIGKLAAGITHEINTPLTYIKGNLELMRMELEGCSDLILKNELISSMDIVDEGLRQIGNIIDATREITKKGSGLKEPTNIYATVVFAARMVFNRTKHIVPIYFNGELFTLDSATDERMIQVNAIKEKLEQVWIVILNNAADEFLKSDKPFDERWIKIDFIVEEGWVRIRFEDNACKIPEKLLSHIFEPFVSSKTHSGMGIGLNIAQSIIREHDGDIQALNEGENAVFVVTLPRRDETLSDFF